MTTGQDFISLRLKGEEEEDDVGERKSGRTFYLRPKNKHEASLLNSTIVIYCVIRKKIFYQLPKKKKCFVKEKSGEQTIFSGCKHEEFSNNKVYISS